MKKRSLLVFSLILVCFFLSAAPSKAASFKNLELLHIKSDEIVLGNLYVVANNIIIDGKIGGDLIAAAKSIIIKGEVAGDLIAMAPEIEISGRVEGNSRIAFNNFNFLGYIGKNLNALGENISLAKDSFVGWDLLSSTNNISLNGLINGDADVSSQKVVFNGEIRKDSNLRLETKDPVLNISPTALVGGKFLYSAREEMMIDNENFKSKVEFSKQSNKQNNSKRSLNLIFSILAALAVASFFVYVLGGIKNKVMKGVDDFKNKDLLPALLFLILMPIIALIIFITIIGIPLSLLLFTFYFLIIYLAKVISAIFMAELMFDKLAKKKYYFIFLFIGVAGTWLIFSLPFVGVPIATVAVLFGLSILIKYVKNQSTNI